MLRGPVVLLVVLAAACGGGGSGGQGGGSATGGSGATGGHGTTGGGSATGGSGGSGGSGGGSATGGSGGNGGGTSGGMITVMGHVLNNAGQPISNATVVVIGATSTTTDAEGAFTIAGVTTPYDIATVANIGVNSLISVVKGVTRANPTLFAFAAGTTPNTGTVTGTLTGTATLPTPAMRSTQVLFESPETSASDSVTSAPYSVGFSWYGATTTTGTMHALQLTYDANNLPTAYNGYGEVANVTLANGNTAANKDIATTAISSNLLSGSVTVPTGMMVGTKSLSVVLGKGSMAIAGEANTSLSFAYNTPVITNATMQMTVSASGSSRTTEYVKNGLAANATGVTLALATPPALSLPVGGATGIALASQSFNWAPMNPAGLYIVQLSMMNRTFTCFTAATSFTLPSTTELGLGTLPTGTAMTWRVQGYGGSVTTTDALTGATGAIGSVLVGGGGDVWLGISETRAFTTN